MSNSLFSFFPLSFFLPGSPSGGEKQSQESYGEMQATRNEGQNPCASKDAAAAVAGTAVAETREGRKEQEVREDETANEKETGIPGAEEEAHRGETRERKKKNTRRKGRAQGRSEREKERKREKGKERLA